MFCFKDIIEEGIFRRCGSLVRQQDLKYKLSNGVDVNLENSPYTVHDCANVLKAYLSELPEPLLSERFFKINCQIPEKTLKEKENDDEEKLVINKSKNMKKLRLLLLLLPLNLSSFVKDLLTLLHKASIHCQSNKMDSRNCATLFAPHLLFPKNLKATEIQQHLLKLTDELQFMIDNVPQIFEPPNELIIDINGELQKIASGIKNDQEDDVINTAITFCNREEDDKSKDITEKQLAELYAYISTMPETPRKKSLIKQFNRQNGGLTPLSVKKNDHIKTKFKNFGICIKKNFHLFPASKRGHKISESGTHTSPMSSWNSNSNLIEDNFNTFKVNQLSHSNASSPSFHNSAKKIKTSK